jgi:hypothetical protein
MNGVSALVVRDRQNLGIKLQFPSSNFEIRAKKEKGTFWIPNSWSPLDLRLALNQRSAATRETRASSTGLATGKVMVSSITCWRSLSLPSSSCMAPAPSSMERELYRQFASPSSGNFGLLVILSLTFVDTFHYVPE